MKKNRFNIRFLSVFLVFLFVMTSFSFPVIAQDAGGSESETAPSGQSVPDLPEFETVPSDEPDEPYPVTEDVSRRDANVKHFDLGYGTYEAVVYPTAVHRKDADGQWQNIDNRLTASGTALYATSDGRTAVAARAGTAEPLITVGENGYRIEMTPAPAIPGNTANADATVTPVAQIQNHADPSVNVSDDPFALADTTTRVTYEDVYPNVDLEYVLTGNDVKENIIVSAPMSSYSYTFLLEIDGLYAVLAQNGDIVLYDADSDEAQYTMPAPYMYDANGVISYDVSYILTESDKQGVYAVTVAADADWFADTSRAFPVTIDPTLQLVCYADTYIDSSYPTTNYASATRLWVSSGAIPFFRMNAITLREGCELVSATLYVYCYYVSYVTSNELTIGAYQVTSPWSTTGITWQSASQNENYGISTTLLSSCVLPGNAGAYESTPRCCSFDITGAFQSWYSGSPNYGIALRYEGGTNTSACIRSRESDTDYSAYYVLKYKEPVITSGVYKIRNVATGKLLDTRDGGFTEGTLLQQWEETTGEVNRNQLFKITYIRTYDNMNYYSIRPMTNSGLGLFSDYVSSDRSVSHQAISTTESWSAINAKSRWIISYDSSGYTIQNGYVSSNSFLTAPDSTNNGELIYTGGKNGNNSVWALEPYTGDSLDGVNWDTYTCNLITGETFTYYMSMYSSTVGRNGPVTYDVVEPDGSATDKATINAETGELIAAEAGQIKVRGHYSGSPWVYVINATIEESLEGTYFIQNKQHSMYLQPQPSDQTTMELRSFDGDNDQRWNLIYVSDVYYKIESVASGKVVAVTSGKEDTNNYELVQEDYTGSDRQLWKFTKSSRGNYVIRPKSGLAYSNDYCMGSANYVGLQAPEGLHVNQRLYTDDTELRDEWGLDRVYSNNLLAWKETFLNAVIPRDAYFSQVSNTIQNYLNDDIYTEFSASFSKRELMERLCYSDIFIMHTHGGKTEFQYSALNTITMDDLDEINLSGLRFALLLTCNTAQDYSASHITKNQPVNIVEKMVCQGAETVIGFTDTTIVSDCNQFAEEFIYATVERGMTVTEALDLIERHRSDYTEDIASLCVIAGNADLTLN